MAVTANQLVTRADACKVSYPVAASTTLYQGTLSFLTVAGYLDDDTGSGENRFAGVVVGDPSADNSAGVAGDLSTDVWNEGVFTLTGTGFTQASVGLDVYATDNYTVTTVPSAAGVYIGKCTGYISSTSIDVELDTGGANGDAAVTQTEVADYTVLAGDSGKTFDTTGASGAVTFTMPAAVAGLKYKFRVGAAQELRIDPDGTETISLPSTGVAGAAGKYLTANAAGETVSIECVVAGTWSVFGFTGTWTAEA